MATKLNLASRPFNNRTLPWMITAVVIVVSLISLIFIVRATQQANAQANAVQNDINNLGQQQRALLVQVEAVKNSFSAEQLQVLDAAHGLVDRKRFSWSRLFADLESALPGAVRVKSIAVRRVVSRGDETLAELDMTVIAKTPNIVTDMIADMDRAGVFHADLRAQNLQRGRGESGTEYELAVIYRPRAGAAIETRTVAANASEQVGGTR